MPASSSRRKGTTEVKRSAALSGHHAAESQSSVDLSPVGTHLHHSSLSAITLDHESDYMLSAEGHDDEDEDDSDDDALLVEQNDGDIPVTSFAVASNKYNMDFHKLFKLIPEGDYLVEGVFHSRRLTPLLTTDSYLRRHVADGCVMQVQQPQRPESHMDNALGPGGPSPSTFHYRKVCHQRPEDIPE